ncbi:hypothetical protein L596_009438 [Steinernema carpocapsae]|uniref:Uncharacterized protein n=1 Tax=Steinernema carpocapsae TaxID=34508 RepID=A0A4U5PG50_STECR|nr:hypothetical protein L596_009438 [Steinernema carpocapsae]
MFTKTEGFKNCKDQLPYLQILQISQKIKPQPLIVLDATYQTPRSKTFRLTLFHLKQPAGSLKQTCLEHGTQNLFPASFTKNQFQRKIYESKKQQLNAKKSIKARFTRDIRAHIPIATIVFGRVQARGITPLKSQLVAVLPAVVVP